MRFDFTFRKSAVAMVIVNAISVNAMTWEKDVTVDLTVKVAL